MKRPPCELRDFPSTRYRAKRGLYTAPSTLANRVPPVEALVRLHELCVEAGSCPALAEHMLWAALLARINWRPLSSQEREALLAILHASPVLNAHARPVLRCLFNQDPLEKEAGETQPPASAEQVTRLFAISQGIWESIRTEQLPLSAELIETDWISAALADGTYHLVRFWMQYLSLQPLDQVNPALPAELATIFSEICTSRTEVARRARAVLVQYLRFVMARDPIWTTTHLGNLFDFTHIGDEAWVGWRPFLAHGGLSRPLALAMLPYYRAAQARMVGAGEKVVGDYLDDVATIMVRVRPDDTIAWLQALLPRVAERDRLRWARLAARDCEGIPDEAQRELWNRWLAAYWHDRRSGRLGGETLVLTASEAAIMTGWLCNLPEVFMEALDLVIRSPAPNFENESFPWRELRSSSLPTRVPIGLVALIEFLLEHMSATRVSHDAISEIADALPRLAALRAPLLRIAEVVHGHSWVPARDFRAKIEREFPSHQ